MRKNSVLCQIKTREKNLLICEIQGVLPLQNITLLIPKAREKNKYLIKIKVLVTDYSRQKVYDNSHRIFYMLVLALNFAMTM